MQIKARAELFALFSSHSPQDEQTSKHVGENHHRQNPESFGRQAGAGLDQDGNQWGYVGHGATSIFLWA
ncbi:MULTISPECIES: hypothetical protein [unclassified Pseudomonas]|uniref:hypothetical protein n=1 Tax=unclassified Pseudomonas TaxID=196821 RepID=UPI00114CF744|nr:MULTISPECIES: hypothetical protein [unclassified Pseudomonas]QIH10168.1 hypothetical protein ATY02_27305 [Pseudomonas sp. BIOMIG1BAC]UMZ10429.1 hypothetical protein I9018_23465 [Pseudomonas sp. MPFS]